jgi:hypothetical protein
MNTRGSLTGRRLLPEALEVDDKDTLGHTHLDRGQPDSCSYIVSNMS